MIFRKKTLEICSGLHKSSQDKINKHKHSSGVNIFFKMVFGEVYFRKPILLAFSDSGMALAVSF